MNEELLKNLKTNIIRTTAGVRTEDGLGEIFNDYSNNKAINEYSHSEGSKSIAGVKGFKLKLGGFLTQESTLKNDKIKITIDGKIKKNVTDRIISIQLDSIIPQANGTNQYYVKYYYNFAIIEAMTYTSNADITTLDVVLLTDIPYKYNDAKEGTANYKNTSYIWFPDEPELGNTIFQDGISHAEGDRTKANGESSHSEGRETIADGKYSHAEGRETFSGYACHAEGRGSIALGEQSHAEGGYTLADGYGCHAEGEHTKAIGADAHAEGHYTNALGSYSHSEGYRNTASGFAAHVEGGKTVGLTGGNTASGTASHAEGSQTIAEGESAHAEGNNTKAIGANSHAEGSSTQALGDSSHAEGSQTIAKGISHAEGYKNTAVGRGSHAEGSETEADPTQDLTLTKDWDKCAAHAEGWLTKALSHGTHAGGVGTYAKGQYSFTHGHNLDTDVPDSFLIGKYGKLLKANSDDSKTLFAIANGDWSADGSKHSIGFRVFKDGHTEVQSQGTTDNSIVINKTLANYAKKTTLNNYVKSTTLNTELENYISKDSILENIISEETITNITSNYTHNFNGNYYLSKLNLDCIDNNSPETPLDILIDFNTINGKSENYIIKVHTTSSNMIRMKLPTGNYMSTSDAMKYVAKEGSVVLELCENVYYVIYISSIGNDDYMLDIKSSQSSLLSI